MELEIPDDAALLGQIDSFLKRTGMAPTRFGRDAVGEASLIDRLGKGRSLSLRLARKVVAFMAEYDAGPSADDERSAPGNADEISGERERAA